MPETNRSKKKIKTGPLGILSTLVGTLTTTGAALGLTALGDAARTKMKTRWRSHVPTLARAVAEMIAADPSFFGWVPFTSAQLLARTQSAAAMLQVRQKLDDFSALFDDALVEGKSGLFDWTTQVVDGVYRLLDSPEVTGARRERLLLISTEVRAIAEAHRAQVATALRNSRQKNARLADAEDSIEKLAEENRTLRGEDAGPVDALRAAAPRKATRRTRR